MTVPTLHEIRAARFAAVVAGYEADGPDSTVPGYVADGRYAVVTESDTRGHGYFVNRTDGPGREVMAAANLLEGWEPVCYFDLDKLDGPDPLMLEADYRGETWIVHGPAWDGGAEIPGEVCLKKSKRDRRSRQYDWAPRVPVAELTNIEYSEDERMPVRYLLAKIIVVFNSTPAVVA